MEQAEIDRLAALVERCRAASGTEIATRPAPDGSSLPTHEYERRNTIVSLRDIAYRRLGAEWPLIAKALEELRERYTVASAPLKHRPMPASSVRLSHRDLTGDQE